MGQQFSSSYKDGSRGNVSGLIIKSSVKDDNCLEFPFFTVFSFGPYHFD